VAGICLSRKCNTLNMLNYCFLFSMVWNPY
jgi:hypothetical protein